jgi:hypothetical protein
MTRCTRLRVSAETSGLRFNTLDTVCVETPAADATSLIVALLLRMATVIGPVIDNTIYEIGVRGFK